METGKEEELSERVRGERRETGRRWEMEIEVRMLKWANGEGTGKERDGPGYGSRIRRT